MGTIEVGAADIHRIIGRSKASAPDPASFRGQRHAQRYGDLQVEHLTRAFHRRLGRSPLDHRRRVMPRPDRPVSTV